MVIILLKIKLIFLVLAMACCLFACENSIQSDNSVFVLNTIENHELTDEEIEKMIDEYDKVDRVAAMESVGRQLKESLKGIENPDEAVITVNDIPITIKTLELQKAMATAPGAGSLKDELIKIVRQKAVVAEATRLGIEPSEDSINQYFETIEKALDEGASGTELMMAYINGLGITVEEYLEEQRDGVYYTYQIEAFRETLDKDVNYEDYVNELIRKADIVILDDEVRELIEDGAAQSSD